MVHLKLADSPTLHMKIHIYVLLNIADAADLDSAINERRRSAAAAGEASTKMIADHANAIALLESRVAAAGQTESAVQNQHQHHGGQRSCYQPS